MKKKDIWKFLLLVTVVAGLVACGNSAPQNVETQPTSNEESTTVVDQTDVDESDSSKEEEEPAPADANTEAPEPVEADDSAEQEPVGATADEEDSTESEPVESEAEAEPPAEPEVDELALDLASFETSQAFTSVEDGFNFRNYSSRFPEGDLVINSAQSMFGDVVCTRLDGETCVPHPKVTAWIDGMNETMHEVGHCTGFTVASNQLHSEVLPVAELGANQTFDLPREVPALRTIAQGYASYYASNVWRQEVLDKTPTEILEALLILDEPVDIGLFYPQYGRNGHSVLGHNVTDQGEGIFHIEVYDSNRPGEDNIIVIDTNADTWFYAEAAINPDVPSSDYQGDAETKSLSFIPISAYNEPLSCPADFAELCPAAGEKFSVVTLVGEGQALVESVAGQIGRVGERLINTITGGRILGVKGELNSRQHPLMLVPEGEAFTLQVQADRVDEPLDLTISSPTFSVVIEGFVGQPGQVEQLNFDPVNQQVSLVSGGNQRLSFELTFNQNGDVYSVQVVGLRFEAGQNLDIAVDNNSGGLRVTSENLINTGGPLIVARLSSTGESVFSNRGLAISSEAPLGLDLSGWDGSGPMPRLADMVPPNAEGTIENMPVSDMLPGLGNASNTIDTLQLILPYLDNGEKEAVTSAIPALGFAAEDLGQAYLHLPDLQPADLPTTLNELAYSPREIGNFAASLRLNPDSRTTLLDNLTLSDEDRAAVETAVEEQEAVLDALEEWEFLGIVEAETLPIFIEEKGLNEAQTSNLLSEIELPQADLAPVRRQYAGGSASGCSVESEVETSITFVNRTNGPVSINWFDFDCGEQSYTTLGPGRSLNQSTFATHPWVARNAAGDALPLGSPDGMTFTVTNNGGSTTVEVFE